MADYYRQIADILRGVREAVVPDPSVGGAMMTALGAMPAGRALAPGRIGFGPRDFRTPNPGHPENPMADVGSMRSIQDIASVMGRGQQQQQAMPAQSALPMDAASRIARAKEGGFYTDMPLGHGTAAEFSAFDPARGATTSASAPGRMGVFSEVRPQAGGIADEFAGMAAQKTMGDPAVMPLLHRAEKPASISLTGNEKNHEIAATLDHLWANGYDAVMMKNYTTPGGKTGNILVVKDPAQLRSPWAAFDPAKRNSGNLLASGAGLFGLGAAAAGGDQR